MMIVAFVIGWMVLSFAAALVIGRAIREMSGEDDG